MSSDYPRGLVCSHSPCSFAYTNKISAFSLCAADFPLITTIRLGLKDGSVSIQEIGVSFNKRQEEDYSLMP